MQRKKNLEYKLDEFIYERNSTVRCGKDDFEIFFEESK